jgi:hypothetical protein
MSLLVSRLRDADSEKQDAPLRDLGRRLTCNHAGEEVEAEVSLSLRALVSRVPGALATGGC